MSILTVEQEQRTREIVREEIAWALKIGARRAVQSRPALQPRQLSQERAARYRAIADDYLSGLTLLDTAVKHGTYTQAVYAALAHCGVPTRQRGAPRKTTADPRLPRFIEMHEAGATLEEIAAPHRITRERVRQILTKAGIDTAQRPLNAEQRAAVERYVAGDSLNLAAASINVSPSTLRGYILRSGHAIRTPTRKLAALTLERSATAARLYREGKTASEIASALGLPKPEMIYRLLSLAGVKPNRRPRAVKQAA